MLSYSSHNTIRRGTFNHLEHGNQYNITNNNYSPPDSQPQFLPEDEWKIQLYREFKRISLGDCNILRTMCEARAHGRDYEDHELEHVAGRDDSRAKRIFGVARLGNGLFSSITYVGLDAMKVFKKDCLAFSQIKHASCVQLHAFNDSHQNPMIFFHDGEL
ncbi:hypothetical protein L218DRAFT_1073 [Marasmius fiardii PR-910]|nr:hypothetical protein L218DRAFT_1073 [Marasmius fiardii PR-910]